MTLAPRCLDGGHSSFSRPNMERAYVRRTFNGSREWIAIGWYCSFCGALQRHALHPIGGQLVKALQ
jgi:hypothetical protein